MGFTYILSLHIFTNTLATGFRSVIYSLKHVEINEWWMFKILTSICSWLNLFWKRIMIPILHASGITKHRWSWIHFQHWSFVRRHWVTFISFFFPFHIKQQATLSRLYTLFIARRGKYSKEELNLALREEENSSKKSISNRSRHKKRLFLYRNRLMCFLFRED